MTMAYDFTADSTFLQNPVKIKRRKKGEMNEETKKTFSKHIFICEGCNHKFNGVEVKLMPLNYSLLSNNDSVFPLKYLNNDGLVSIMYGLPSIEHSNYFRLFACPKCEKIHFKGFKTETIKKEEE